MNVEFECMVGVGEHIKVSFNVPSNILKDAEKGKTQDLIKFLRPGFFVMDFRRHELNTRLMATHGLAQNLPPQVQLALKQTIDFLHGMAGGQEPGQNMPDPKDVEADQANIQKALSELDKAGQADSIKPVLKVVKPDKPLGEGVPPTPEGGVSA